MKQHYRQRFGSALRRTKIRQVYMHVCCTAYELEKKWPLFIVPEDSVNRKILFHKVNAVTWLLWPAVCVQMMKVIHIWNDWLSFFHSSPVEQTPSITPFDVLLCVSNSHSVGRYMCHTVCLVSVLETDSSIQNRLRNLFLSLFASSLFMHIYYKHTSVIKCLRIRFLAFLQNFQHHPGVY